MEQKPVVSYDEYGLYYNGEAVEQKIDEPESLPFSLEKGKIKFDIVGPRRKIWVYTKNKQPLSKDKQLIMNKAQEWIPMWFVMEQM